jgi:hypothetical protein
MESPTDQPDATTPAPQYEWAAQDRQDRQDSDDTLADLGLRPSDEDNSGLPGPALLFAVLGGVVTVLLLAAYQAAQIVAWCFRLITSA